MRRRVGATCSGADKPHFGRPGDWIFVAAGYDLAALQDLRAGDLADDALSRRGVEVAIQAGLYALSHACTPSEAIP
jgi:hypothetical protein